jgi:regulator of replication initiation timing
MSTTGNSRIYAIIVTLLLLASAAIGWVFWNKSQEYQKSLRQQEARVDSLTQVKMQLEQELDNLSQDYAALRTENESLQGQVAQSATIVEQKEIVIKQIKADASREVKALEKQIEDLKKIRTEYETIISLLREENRQLREENQRLTEENTQLQGRVEDIAKQLEEQIRKTQSAQFRATSFRVEVVRRADKLVTKARQARELLISFDLVDVPPIYQGPQKLYLVVTDDKGKPIPAANPIQTTVYAPTGPVEIQAQQAKQVVLETTQRMSFSYQLEDRLKAGSYVVAIYCDKGLLGASSFRLR